MTLPRKKCDTKILLQPKGERVASYCRVSTDDVDQAISITQQIRESKRKIKANPNWKYVGTYVDDGFSGTNTEHRQGFQKLMADAMDGKIDLIITKAVSRFARNLMDCIHLYTPRRKVPWTADMSAGVTVCALRRQCRSAQNHGGGNEKI